MAEEAPRAKRQHYVPQFLLEGFLDKPDGVVHVFDKKTGQVFATGPGNLAAEAGFYDVPHGGMMASIEPELSRIESEAAPVIRGIVRERRLRHLTSTDRDALAVFTAVQIARTRGARERLSFMGKAICDWVERQGYSLDQVEGLQRPTEDQVKLQSVASSMRAAENFAPLILEKSWLLCEAPADSDLYLSDNPVVMDNQNATPGRGNLGLSVPGIEVYLPVSAGLCLLFLCRDTAANIIELKKQLDLSRQLGAGTPPFISEREMVTTEDMYKGVVLGSMVPLADETVVHLNSLQVIGSSRFVFSSKGDFGLVSAMLEQCPQLRGPQMPEVG